MTTLRPYPAYKDSGVGWLGDVPEHWNTRRLKRLATINPSKSEITAKTEEDEVVFLPMEKVSSRGHVDSSIRRRLGDVRSGFTYFQNGDVIVAKITPCFENGKSALVDGLETGIGFGSTEFHVLRASLELEPRFLYRLVSSHDFLTLGEESMEGAGGQKRVPTRFVAAFESPLPPLDEQRAIADFLDGMDARITRFLAARRRMIALLEEQKQVVINQAVTRGLDPDVPLKDSGVDWLGEIPANWELRRIKDFLREVDERSETGEEVLLSVSHLTGVTPRSEKTITMFKAESYVGHKLCRPGDIVANTMWLWMGAIGTSRHTGIVSSSYAVYRPSNERNIEPSYLDLLLRTRRYIDEYWRHSTGIRSSRLRLYPEQFLRLKIALPPIEEQRAISVRIDREISRIDGLIDRHRREIDLMQEYRTRLISDVVTGKLDVRGLELPPVEAVIGEEIEAAMEEAPIPS